MEKDKFPILKLCVWVEILENTKYSKDNNNLIYF